MQLQLKCRKKEGSFGVVELKQSGGVKTLGKGLSDKALAEYIERRKDNVNTRGIKGNMNCAEKEE